MRRRLRLFPLNAVLFPGAVLNLHIFEPRYKQLIAECLESGETFGVSLIAEGSEAGDPNVMPHEMGSIAEIVEVQALPLDRYFISTIGRERFRIEQIVSREPYLLVEAETVEEDDPPEDDHEIEELLPAVRELFDRYLEMMVEFSGQETSVELPMDALGTSFLIADSLQITEAVKQRLLELNDTKSRLRAENEFLERLLPQLRNLLERRRAELERRGDAGDDDAFKAEQEKFFGKAFSQN